MPRSVSLIDTKQRVNRLCDAHSHACMQARVEDMVGQQRQKMDTWRQQNERDQRADMQQLEGLMLQAVGGVNGLKQQLATQEGILRGHAVGLEQVQRWLAEMHASSSVITSQPASHHHQQRLHAKVDVIQEGVDDIRLGQEAIAAKLDRLYSSMKRDAHGIAKFTELGPSELMIPRSSIVIHKDALSQGSAGNFGTVVRAERDGGAVAVKVYNISQAGEIEQKGALKEALLLSQIRHHNVVKCWGLVHDPDSAQKDSLHGSLVMEWVRGGNLYVWLQDNAAAGLKLRVQVAQQVAAGMQHLHQQGLVHGDVKPQNILLQFMQGDDLPEVSRALYLALAVLSLESVDRTRCLES
jgi:hypothetical protein